MCVCMHEYMGMGDPPTYIHLSIDPLHPLHPPTHPVELVICNRN